MSELSAVIGRDALEFFIVQGVTKKTVTKLKQKISHGLSSYSNFLPWRTK
jgi:hypothetical protein